MIPASGGVPDRRALWDWEGSSEKGVALLPLGSQKLIFLHLAERQQRSPFGSSSASARLGPTISRLAVHNAYHCAN